ncbi:unnamed product [Ostreococcus tauri]|uniref:Unnamed product n=1 Tax=Ostreococcus tauri TaxID=70448 RepID=Q01BC0_OSTTA|nr:unnamed product [Ostreococcus tauri]CAL51526.1 unnamed product [Ostreococcus tauri]|eukprot:XP_003078646.1 unnamed product [Ostreococcus tauri]
MRARGRVGAARVGARASESARANGRARTRARGGVEPGITGPSVRRGGCDVGDDGTSVDAVVSVEVTRASETRSRVRVRSRSAPGLLRSVAWALNGMDLIAHECAIATDAEGMVDMEFEVTERCGSSGTKQRAIEDEDLIRERLFDYLAQCSPHGEDVDAQERLEEDGVIIDNSKNSDSTYVAVRVPPGLTSDAILLYPIGNTFTGSGLVVKSGKLTKGVDHATGAASKTWEFDVVRNDDRKKLLPEQLQALMYTLALVCSPSSFGRSHAFTSR